jgi:CelD/BcsL family acetyltransferase involved in cellulose biosynthesis
MPERVSACRTGAATEVKAPTPARKVAALSIDAPEWKQFVRSQPGALGYHDPPWGLMLAECYGFRPFALGLFEQGRILAGLPVVETRTLRRKRRWISLPFTDHCPPLAVTESASREFAAGLGRFRREEGVERLDVHAHVAGPTTFTREAAFMHTVDLSRGSSSLYAELDSSQVKRGIKRSRREGVTIRRAERETELTDIYYDLHLHTRRRHGIPVQPRRFFELLWRRILEPGHGFLLLAYSGHLPVAGTVFLIGRETVTYKYNASRPESWRKRPNHALIWHSMDWACANGFRTYDFGLTHFPNRGLRDFKRRWAAHEDVLHHSVVADAAPGSRLADGVTESALGTAIRHGPLWLCRGLGELFYKHAA